MTDFLDRISGLSPKRLALLALEQHEQLQAARSPIAVVGMGCRFPGGADSLDAYWQLLRDKRDAIREVPRDRWDIDAYYDPDPDAPGSIAVRTGGFLDRVDGFDAEFFGISPREARTMDPQQRLLLEVSWEALENAGIAPESLAGSSTGVWVGVCNSDHFLRVIEHAGEAVDMYLASGNAPSVVAGRVSYFLGLRGPALAIDTACSSSLVAVHSAVRSLRSGEVDVALAGGVNVMCAPETMIALSRAHMLAPDGRCKTFDASADGFARGEGCGVVVLKRLADAERDGDQVLAIVRGAAANQDGRSTGLTVPNGPAQESVIRDALRDAGLAPADVDYVEAHGTGTSLGDPIEVNALAAAYGPGRAPNAPLTIGSAKTNFGHLESAAGIAGIIKTVLALRHEWIPAHLNFKTPSPHIPWAKLPVVVAANGKAWPRSDTPRRAGVSSFGFSGTNAHIVLEEAPQQAVTPAETAELRTLPLSARTPAALAASASAWEAALRATNAPTLREAAIIAGSGRSHFSERAAIVAPDNDEAATALAALAAGAEHPALRRGRATPGVSNDVVFLFTGQGSQYPGLGATLYGRSPDVRDVLDRCDAILGPDEHGVTLLEVMRDQSETSPIHETRWTQPATFAVQMALVALWRSWGVKPAATLGHSAGEYAAACAAGVFSLEDGLRLIAARGRLMHALGPGGAMAAVNAPTAVVEAELSKYNGRVVIAAYNADDAVVVSGEDAHVHAMCEALTARQIECRKLWVPLASHSPLMDAGLGAMEDAARGVVMRAPEIPVAWNLTGGVPLPGGAPDARYWRRHLREPVRFADGIRTLWNDGFRTFLEIGPHPVLVALASRALGEPSDFAGVASLRRGKDEWRELTLGVAELYAHGAAIDWRSLNGGIARPASPLPTYPFERKRYWVDVGAGRASRRSSPRTGKPLALTRVPVAVPLFETTLTPDRPHWLGEHRVHGMIIAAGPVMLELAQAAAVAATGAVAAAVEDFLVEAPLVIHETGTAVQVELQSGSSDETSFRIHARAADAASDEPWQLCASGRLTQRRSSERSSERSLGDLRASLGPVVSSDEFFARLTNIGVELGSSFRGMRSAQRGDREVLARVELPVSLAGESSAWAHPALLDAALQALGLAIPTPADPGDTYLFAGIERVELTTPLPQAVWVHVQVAASPGDRPAEWRGEIRLFDDGGRIVGTMAAVSLRRATRESLARTAGAAVSDVFYEIAWRPAPLVGIGGIADVATAPLHTAATARYEQLAEQHDLRSYDRLSSALDRRGLTHVLNALRELGFDDAVGRAFTATGEATTLGVASAHTRLFARVLDLLAAAGGVTRSADEFVVARPLQAIAIDLAAMLQLFQSATPELTLLDRCGSQLSDVLRGTHDPLALLFPNGDTSDVRYLYEESGSARTMNGTLAAAVAAVAAVAADASSPSSIRVLEIGGGTGGTTGAVLDALPAGRTSYTFTDISPRFVDRAAERFGSRDGMRFLPLDIERDPTSQGFASGGFDMVVAANVLHATADLVTVMRHVRSLLAPGGVLLLVEGMSPEPWIDLTFGLTDGWWRFDDDVRRDYPLVGPGEWNELLARTGFEDTAVIPDGPMQFRAMQQRVVVARASKSPEVRTPLRWTIVGDQRGVASAVASILTSRGDVVHVYKSSDVPSTVDGSLIYLAGLDADDSEQASAQVHRALRWLAAFGSSVATDIAPRAWIATRGAQSVDEREPADGRWQAPLWGLGRVFALEQPTRWGGLVDLASDENADAAATQLLQSLEASDDEDQTAWRGGERRAARLLHAAAPKRRDLAVRADGTYLITGGFGGLGLVVAQWLAGRGARTIALLGRNPDPATDAIKAIEAAGARVVSLAGDIADASTMEQHFARFGRDLPPLAGVIHAAASFSSAPIASLTDADVTRMLAPKIAGTMVLERFLDHHAIDWMILFSSTTALFGATGFAHYAAANAFLDATARVLRRAGKPVTSIDWGTWEVMRLVSTAGQQTYKEAGLEPLAVSEACDALGRAVSSGLSQAIVARIDWETLKPLHEARRRRPFFAEVGHNVGASSRAAAQAATSAGLRERLADLSATARAEFVIDFVSREVAAVLGSDPDTHVQLDVGFFDMGMDSLMSVELRSRLERAAGRKLPSTLTFNYPTVRALAGYLEGILAPRAAEPAPAASVSPPPSTLADVDADAMSEDDIAAMLSNALQSID